MKSGMVKSIRRACGVSLACSVLTLSGCVLGPISLEHETRVMSVQHTAPSPLVVLTRNGAVAVSADPSATDVSITADVKAQTLERLAATKVVSVREPDGTLRVEVAWPDGKALDGEGCGLDITVPAAQNVDISSSNGALSITGLSGTARLRTSNGRITASRHAGPVDADTSNGAVVITDPGADVRAESSNGSIEITNAPGRVFADTSNGRITIVLADSSPGPVVADSSNGSIQLTVGTAFRGTLVADTSNARIAAEGLGSTAKVSVRKSDGTIVFGDGGEPSSCKTSNGSITVRGR